MCLVPREDFPELILRRIVYLDNAASTLKPRQVIDAMSRFAYESYANVHRGIYGLSIEASRAYENAHQEVADFIGGSWDEVVFVRNTSEAIQLAVMLLVFNRILGRGDEVIVTETDHHSLILPIIKAARFVGANVKIIQVDSNGIPRWDQLPQVISRKTRVVAVTHKSNVTGYVSDVKRIAKIAHENDAIVIVDGAQSVPHMPVDVKDLDLDFLAFSGHKMLGPTGIGVLWGRMDLMSRLEPPLGGGGTVKRVKLGVDGLDIVWEDPPWRFETGTPPIIEAIGLSEAIRYIKRVDVSRIYEHEKRLTVGLMKRLEDLEEHIRIIGPIDPELRSGIVSFTIMESSPELIGMWLDKRGIAVRTGLHCVHLLHDRIGSPEGSVRASFYIYNCEDDLEALYKAIKEYIEHRPKNNNHGSIDNSNKSRLLRAG
jgi:cysteine desulfurase/selenocysteine lyase